MLIKSKSAWRTLLMLLLTNNMSFPMDYVKTNWFIDSSPCLVVLARYEIDAPVTATPTSTAAPSSSTSSTQTTHTQKEKHFFLLMQFQSPNKKFGVEKTESLNRISTLTNLLFPDKSNQQIFVFDSKNLNNYIDKINNLANDETLLKWWFATQSLPAVAYKWDREVTSDADVKRKLIDSINSFNTKINELTNMQFVTDPMNPVLSIAKTIVTDTDPNKLKEKQNNIEYSLGKTLFARIEKSTQPSLFDKLSETETKNLQELMQRVTTAHISYVADLSSDKLINALPRAMYREVETLCKTLHVSAPGFKPFLLDTQFLKRSAINTARLASMVGLGVLFGGIAAKYNWGYK